MIPDAHELLLKLEADGEDAVREKLALKVYGEQKGRFVEEWLKKKERSRAEAQMARVDQREEESLAISRQANDLAEAALDMSDDANRLAAAANQLSEDANRIAHESRHIADGSRRMATASVVVSILAILVAVISQCSSR
jgi:hypothetical protein